MKRDYGDGKNEELKREKDRPWIDDVLIFSYFAWVLESKITSVTLPEAIVLNGLTTKATFTD